jgi:hypothetical protein
MFLDERGTGLRVTWHPERDLVVLSVWQDDRCVGTFRMLVQDVPRLSSLLAAALGDWVDQAGTGPEGPQGPGGRAPSAAAGGRGPEAEVGGREADTEDAGWEPAAGVGSGEAGAGAGGREAGGGAVGSGVSLSVQRRIRLSRPVLRLRGLRHRRRGPG